MSAVAVEIFAIIAPVLIGAGLGFAWVKAGRGFDNAFITDLVVTIGIPCLIFSSLTRIEAWGEHPGVMIGAGLAVVFGGLAVAFLFLKASGKEVASFLPALTFANTGNMGLPLCYFAFGTEGLALGAVLFAVNSLCQHTLGVSIAAGRIDPRMLLRIPVLWAVLAAVAFIALDLKVPAWIATTTQMFGGLVIPLMLIALGVSLAQLGVRHLSSATVLGIARLAIGFAIGNLVAWALGFDGVGRGVTVIMASMPIAVFNYLWAFRFGRRHEEVAGAIVLSTLVSFVTLPALVWYVLPG